MPEDHFGEDVARRFDERYGYQADPAVVDPMVDFLAELAGTAPRSSSASAPGRIALPLARRGVRVHGIDLSEAMVARLRGEAGRGRDRRHDRRLRHDAGRGTFAVAYLVPNTIMNLTTQDEQVACFRNVAAHLEPGGCS